MVLFSNLMISPRTERALRRKADQGRGWGGGGGGGSESKVKFVIGGGDVPAQLAFGSGGYTGLIKT